jgi:carbon monoxide dehydrogenase subunit G
MLLKISEELSLEAPPQHVWTLLRDTPRLAALLPGVEAVSPLNDPGTESYRAKAGDKIGPFKVALNMEIRIAETREPAFLKAQIKGADAIGLNRLTGSLHVALIPTPPATLMRFDADIEILGKLATLGAAPIRRRVTEKFAEFARNIQAQFASDGKVNARPESSTRAQSTADVRAAARAHTKKDRR